MGNICSSCDKEKAKNCPLVDTTNTNGTASDWTEDTNEYDPKAQDREEQIMLHQKQRRISRPDEASAYEDEGGGSSATRNWTKVKSKLMKSGKLKRMAFMATPMDATAASPFIAPSFPKSSETTEFLLKAMSTNFLFDAIDEEKKLQLADAMQPQEYQEGEWIMRQGDVGDYFYIVEEGEVAIHVAGKEELETAKKDPNYLPPQVGTGSKGSTFGELALLYNTPRAASIRALTPLKSYKIDQITFRSLLMTYRSQDRNQLKSMIEDVDVFKDLDETQLHKLVDAVTEVEFGPGERIVNKGDEGNIFYIVKSGQVKVEDIGHGNSQFRDHILEQGQSFGERALITGETRAANVSAVTPSSLLAISKDVLEEIIGPLEEAGRQSRWSNWLGSIPLFEGLERNELDLAVKCLKEETYKKGDTLSTSEGKLYLIEEGHVLMMIEDIDVVKKPSRQNKRVTTVEQKLVKFEEGDYFVDLWGGIKKNGDSEMAAVQNVINEKTISVEADMKCLALRGKDVKKVLGDRARELTKSFSLGSRARELTKSFSLGSRARELTKSFSLGGDLMRSAQRFTLIKKRRVTTNRDVMNLKMLNKHRILGAGTFGKVWLVTPKSNSEDKPTPYALKMVSKRLVVQQQLVSTVLREKNIMESIKHPFLLRMESSFQDENYLYFVMHLIMGGELFDLLYPDDQNVIDENPAWKESDFYKSFGKDDDKPIEELAGLDVRKAVFYSACVIEAFAYLHGRHIVYRDLKPENVMINDKGYCVVVDMGFAKVVTDKTYTMCGTPEYLAPEIIANKGHNHVADYWSFACLLYELLVGQTPFFRANIGQMALLKKIVSAQYSFPKQVDDLGPDGSSSLDKTLINWKDLVIRLLNRKSVERLGNLRNGIMDIMDHDWFANIEFSKLRNQSIPAPWVPTIVDPMDTSHFGKDFTQEEGPEVFNDTLPRNVQELFLGF